MTQPNIRVVPKSNSLNHYAYLILIMKCCSFACHTLIRCKPDIHIPIVKTKKVFPNMGFLGLSFSARRNLLIKIDRNLAVSETTWTNVNMSIHPRCLKKRVHFYSFRSSFVDGTVTNAIYLCLLQKFLLSRILQETIIKNCKSYFQQRDSLYIFLENSLLNPWF